MPNKGFAKRLLANWPAKVLSLAAALLLFSFYRLNRLEDRYISVPLSVSRRRFRAVEPDPALRARDLPGRVERPLFHPGRRRAREPRPFRHTGRRDSTACPSRSSSEGTALGVDPLEIRTDPAEVSIAMERRTTRVVPVTPSFKVFSNRATSSCLSTSTLPRSRSRDPRARSRGSPTCRPTSSSWPVVTPTSSSRPRDQQG